MSDQELFDDLIVSTHFHEDVGIPKNNSPDNINPNEASFNYTNIIKCYDINKLNNCDGFNGNFCWPSRSIDHELEDQHMIHVQEDNQSLLQRHLEEEELRLLMEQDSCMICEANQKAHLLDLPEDCIVNIFQYLVKKEILKLARVSKQIRHLYKNDVLWERFYYERFGQEVVSTIHYIDHHHQDNIQDIQLRHDRVRRNSANNSSRLKELKERSKQGKKAFSRRKPDQAAESSTHKEKSSSSSPVRSNSTCHTPPHYHFYQLYKNRVLDARRKREERERMHKEEELRKHYEKVLRQPQRWSERFYFLYTPLFFLLSFTSTLCTALYLDNYIPASKWNTALVLAPYVFVTVPLYFVATGTAVLSDYLRMLRWSSPFDSVISMMYLGNVWLPLLSCLVPLKIFILPQDTPWRAAIAPQWIYSFVYIIASIVIHKKIRRIKFEVDQKVIMTFTCVLNLAVSMTMGFVSAKLDFSLQSSLQYSTFVFFPVWAIFLAALIAVPVGAYVFLHEEGLKPTLFIYFPLILAFIVPLIPFFVLMGLRMDEIVRVHYLIIASPLYLWQLVWFFISSVFVIILERGRSPA
ncbi:8 TM domain-containing transmembrane protein [Acrasis kona]|uniref:8 TM domain-containing transmembrane protein n=1 Tax=Acrasis kona TaxID=1008807 RepID=A0AAW2Z9W2_9EUKA